MSEEGNIEEIRKASHVVNPAEDLDITVTSPEGKLYILEAFRTPTDQNFVMARLSSPGSELDEFAGEEVIAPSNLEATKAHRFDYVRRHKGTLITIGSVVITIAASTGILVRRHGKNK